MDHSNADHEHCGGYIDTDIAYFKIEMIPELKKVL